jgi:hypothetical protein
MEGIVIDLHSAPGKLQSAIAMEGLHLAPRSVRLPGQMLCSLSF